MHANRPSQLAGRARLRGLRTETKAAAEELAHERHRFEELAGAPKVVIAVAQFFPTPADLAARVVELADIRPGMRVLEPSAGLGALVNAVHDACPSAEVVAIEIEPQFCRALETQGIAIDVGCADFLDCGGRVGKRYNNGQFDRVVMNPPFTKFGSIKHIEHARTHFLKPGGKLVAICANGPREREKLKPQASAWHDLPAGSFKESGTNVSAAIVVFEGAA